MNKKWNQRQTTNRCRADWKTRHFCSLSTELHATRKELHHCNLWTCLQKEQHPLEWKIWCRVRKLSDTDNHEKNQIKKKNRCTNTTGRTADGGAQPFSTEKHSFRGNSPQTFSLMLDKFCPKDSCAAPTNRSKHNHSSSSS